MRSRHRPDEVAADYPNRVRPGGSRPATVWRWLLSSDAFRAAWDASLAAGHRVTIGILSGSDTTAIENTDGTVVLNLTPVVNSLVAEGAGFLSGLLDRDVNAPELTSDDIDAAIAALEQQLGTDLPADFGQVVLFQSDDLAAAQRAYQVARTSAWLAPLAALVMVLIALAVAPNRVRAALGITIGVALGMLLVAIALRPMPNPPMPSPQRTDRPSGRQGRYHPLRGRPPRRCTAMLGSRALPRAESS